MTTLAVSTVEPARTQYATTSLYHLQLIALTRGLVPLIAVMPASPGDLAAPTSG